MARASEDAGGDDDQPGIEKEAHVVMLIGESEEHGGAGVDDEADEGEDIRRDPSERETVDYGLEKNSTGSAKGAGPRSARDCRHNTAIPLRREWWLA